MKVSKLVFPVICFLFLLSCKQISHNENSVVVQKSDNKATEILADIESKSKIFRIDTKEIKVLDSINQEFGVYYSKFISDSTYQKSHLKFPFPAVEMCCESITVLDASNWVILNWDFRKDFDNPLDSNLLYQNSEKFYYENYRKEVGLIFRMGFEKVNGTWLLTLYENNFC